MILLNHFYELFGVSLKLAPWAHAPLPPPPTERL